MIILYLIFIKIILNNIIKLKIIIFIKKDNINYITIILKSNIYSNFDIQILNIFKHDLSNILIFNIYNEK